MELREPYSEIASRFYELGEALERRRREQERLKAEEAQRFLEQLKLLKELTKPAEEPAPRRLTPEQTKLMFGTEVEKQLADIMYPTIPKSKAELSAFQQALKREYEPLTPYVSQIQQIKQEKSDLEKQLQALQKEQQRLAKKPFKTASVKKAASDVAAAIEGLTPQIAEKELQLKELTTLAPVREQLDYDEQLKQLFPWITEVKEPEERYKKLSESLEELQKRLQSPLGLVPTEEEKVREQLALPISGAQVWGGMERLAATERERELAREEEKRKEQRRASIAIAPRLLQLERLSKAIAETKPLLRATPEYQRTVNTYNLLLDLVSSLAQEASPEIRESTLKRISGLRVPTDETKFKEFMRNVSDFTKSIGTLLSTSTTEPKTERRSLPSNVIYRKFGDKIYMFHPETLENLGEVPR